MLKEHLKSLAILLHIGLFEKFIICVLAVWWLLLTIVFLLFRDMLFLCPFFPLSLTVL